MWFLFLFVEEIYIFGVKLIMVLINVGGGGGSVGVLIIIWKVSIYKNLLCRKGVGKSLKLRFWDFLECKIWYLKFKFGYKL